jgi:hypothetical protein
VVGVQVGQQHVIDIARIDDRRSQIGCHIAGVKAQRVPTTGIDQDLAVVVFNQEGDDRGVPIAVGGHEPVSH